MMWVKAVEKPLRQEEAVLVFLGCLVSMIDGVPRTACTGIITYKLSPSNYFVDGL